jgi:hypothetical protein
MGAGLFVREALVMSDRFVNLLEQVLVGFLWGLGFCAAVWLLQRFGFRAF